MANKGVAVKVLSPEELRETLLVRLPLETLALSEAIPRMTERDFERLDATVTLMQQCKDIGKWLELNQRFHLDMYEPAQLRRLQNIITGLWAGMRPYVGVYVATARNLRKSQSEHVELVSAIRARDTPRALSILQGHFADTRDAVIAALEKPSHIGDRSQGTTKPGKTRGKTG